TPMYMAPEQIGEKPITAATDLFALGLIAYTLLVGEPYWAVDKSPSGLYSMLMKLAQGPQESASARASRTRGVTLPPAFDAWFSRATAKDPAHRFASAVEQVAGFVAAFDLATASRPGAAT